MNPIFAGLGPEIRGPLLDHDNRLRALEQPKAPQRVYVSQATTAAELVDPSRYRNCMVWLSSLNTFAVSDGIHWIRQDTQGAL